MTVLLHQQGEASQAQTAKGKGRERRDKPEAGGMLREWYRSYRTAKKSPLAGAQKYRHSISCQRQVPSLMTIGTLGWPSDHGKAVIST